MIYFIQEDSGPIKIGSAESVKGRLSNWQTHTIKCLKVLAKQEGGRNLERRLHKRFESCRIKGEWFHPAPELMEYINSLPMITDFEFVDTYAGYLPKIVKLLKQAGENIKLARLRRRITSTMLAERAGMTRTTLYSIERGSPRVSFGKYARVLHALGLELDIGSLANDDQFGRKLQDIELLGRDDF